MHQTPAEMAVASPCRLYCTVPVSASLASGRTICGEKACENCDLSSNRSRIPPCQRCQQRSQVFWVQVRQPEHNTLSLLPVYVHMRRNGGASGQWPTSGAAPSVFGNGRVLDSQTPNPPHGHSSAFQDPMAMSEDEEELVISQLTPSSPGSPQGHASFESEAQPSPLTHLKALSKVQSRRIRTSTPEIIHADGADNRKPNATHITTVVFPRPMRPTETAPDSTPDGSRCDMKLSDLTTQDIEIHLDGVPVPFDFSLEETSLWYHPIFEARAMVDIRRSLRALLPSDPSQDPSPVDTDDWRSEVRPRRSGVQIWERPEDVFGSGPGLWPKSKVRSLSTGFSLDTC
jgi:hypothetical protein